MPRRKYEPRHPAQRRPSLSNIPEERTPPSGEETGDQPAPAPPPPPSASPQRQQSTMDTGLDMLGSTFADVFIGTNRTVRPHNWNSAGSAHSSYTYAPTHGRTYYGSASPVPSVPSIAGTYASALPYEPGSVMALMTAQPDPPTMIFPPPPGSVKPDDRMNVVVVRAWHFCGWEKCCAKPPREGPLPPAKDTQHLPVCHEKCWREELERMRAAGRDNKVQGVRFCHRICYSTDIWLKQHPDQVGLVKEQIPCFQSWNEIFKWHRFQHAWRSAMEWIRLNNSQQMAAV